MPRNPATTLTPEQRAVMSQIGKLGNAARNAKLTDDEKSAIALKAVKERERLRRLKKREAKRRAKQQPKVAP